MKTIPVFDVRSNIQVMPGDTVLFDPQHGEPDPFWNGHESIDFYRKYKGQKGTVLNYATKALGPMDSENPGISIDGSGLLVRFSDGKEVALKVSVLKFEHAIDGRPRMTQMSCMDTFGRVGNLPEPDFYYPLDIVRLATDAEGVERIVTMASIAKDDSNFKTFGWEMGHGYYKVSATEAEKMAHEEAQKKAREADTTPRPFSGHHVPVEVESKERIFTDIVLVRRGPLYAIYNGLGVEETFGFFDSPKTELEFWAKYACNQVEKREADRFRHLDRSMALEYFRNGQADVILPTPHLIDSPFSLFKLKLRLAIYRNYVRQLMVRSEEEVLTAKIPA